MSQLYSSSLGKQGGEEEDGGGGLYLAPGSSVEIQKSAFLNNNASTFGGALSGTNTTLTCSSSVFSKNVVEKLHGGAISISGGEEEREGETSFVQLGDNVFHNNVFDLLKNYYNDTNMSTKNF